MKKNQIVRGVITITYNFTDTFPSDWDDEQIIEWIRLHYTEYIDNDETLDYVEITSEEIDEYGGDDINGI